MQSQTLSGFLASFLYKEKYPANHCPYLKKWYNIIRQSPRYNLFRLEQYGNLKNYYFLELKSGIVIDRPEIYLK